MPSRIARSIATSLACTALLLANTVCADTYLVTSASDDGSPGTLRWAIGQANAAAGPHRIEIDALEITLSSALPPLITNYEIQGAGRDETIIQASATEDDILINWRVFEIGSTAEILLSDLTVRHGALIGDGAGILNEGVLTLADVAVRGNHSHEGSDVEVGPDSLGGGIASTGTLTTRNSIISGNFSTGGTGKDGGSALGGGVYIGPAGSADIQTTMVSGNVARGGEATFDNGGFGEGGGIYLADGGTLTISRSTISGNECFPGIKPPSGGDGAASGGALFVRGNNPNTIQISLSTISGNTVHGLLGTGGGIVSSGGLTIDSCTIVNNVSVFVNNGAGWYISSTAGPDGPYARNTIICNNFSGGGSDPRDFSGHLKSRGFLMIGTPSPSLTSIDTSSGANTAEGNQIVVVDPMLGPLADNGGPTWTHAPLSSSPALNAGTDTFIDGSATLIDQRGLPRVSTGGIANSSALQADIGAVEWQGAESAASSYGLYE
jgi:hypothetical protein